MPKLKTDDDIDIVAFSREELVILDDYFRGTNAETAYMLGRFCGLRINECFGLKWENVDTERGTITIDRQMQYQDGLIKLVPLKTHNARRTLYMCDKLKVYFQELARRRSEDEIQFAALRSQNQRLIEDLGGKQIFSTELVNCLPNGKIQTVNSMKYPTREIKTRFHIDFKYHHLRHPYVKPKTKIFIHFECAIKCPAHQLIFCLPLFALQGSLISKRLAYFLKNR